ncbi:tubulin-like doman-containing protein [Candidatus Ruminimicrobium bovinum]|uniref:tubulin-like doman-containing protein n=1 Tax=Candidatus Ruminimicrobium bovinum TaxID=3242779 RepID=UPI0039B9526D
MLPQQNHILIGLGGSGGKVLKAFKKRLYQEFTADERAKLPIGFVYVDSTDEMMRADDKSWYVLGKNAQFTNNEFVFIKGVDLNQVFANPSGFPGLKGIIGDPEVMQKTIGELGVAAGQKRRAGRILFGANIDKYKSAVLRQYEATKRISGVDCTYIHIFTGLAGGTGSGAILDVIGQTRMLPPFRKELTPIGAHQYDGTSIVAFCMIPEITPPGTCDAGRYHANGYAALEELNAMLVKRHEIYDVTGTSPTGKLTFTGKNVAGGLMLYTNVNEHGIALEPHKELPQVVSDFAFARVFLENNDNTEEYLRSYSFENIKDWDAECYEKAKDGAIIPYRTKRVGTFGIKRIVVPDEEIKDFFTYSLGRQSLLQMKYNNWNDDQGFRDQPAKIDWGEYVRGTDTKLGNPLEEWHFTDKHLILDIPILPSDDGKWGTFQSYWSMVVPRWLEVAKETSQPIGKLNELVAKGIQSGFRGAGIADFFAGKKDAREQHAEEIVDRIETSLFQSWSDGRFSLYNLGELIDTIIYETDKRSSVYENRIVKLRQAVDKLEEERKKLASEYNRAGVIANWIRGNRVLADYSETMTKICMRRTEVEGVGFGLELMRELLRKFNLLKIRIENFVKTINQAIDETDRQIGARCRDEVDLDDLKGTVIRFYDQPGVKRFVSEMIHSKRNQESISTAVRAEIVSRIGSEKTFGRANETINLDALIAIFDETVRNKVVAIHDATLLQNNEKLINRSILEQLSERYPTEDDLRKFAQKIMNESGGLVKFNDTEVRLSVNNNPTTEVGQTVQRKTILVYMPNPLGNQQVQAFAVKLKNALVAAGTAGIDLHVDMTGDRQNEISVLSITYCFPFRVIDNLKFYKEKYDYLTNNVSPSEVHQNRVVLHTEGDGTGLPSLFLAPEKMKSELRREFMPYVILATAMDIIKNGDLMDGTGRTAYGTVKVDELLGLETLNALAPTFTEIGTSEKFTEAFCEDLKEKVVDLLKTKYMHLKNREAELVPKVQQLLSGTILPETGNNTGAPAFLEFAQAAREAINIIKA